MVVAPLLLSPLQAPTTLLLPPFLGLLPPAWLMSTVAVLATSTMMEEGAGSTTGLEWWAWPRSTSPHRGQPWAGRRPSTLRGRRRWWAMPQRVESQGLGREGAGPSPRPAPRKGRDNTIALSPRNRQRQQPQGRHEPCFVSRSRTPSAGPASAS